MKRMKKLLCLLLAVMLTAVLWGCGKRAEETMELSVAVADRPRSLDPAMVTSDTESTLAVHLFENLMRPTAEGTVPAMAKGYTVTDNLDGTETYTFTLRSEARWSDGTPVTARDFVFAWRRLVDPDTVSPNAAMLNMVAGFDQAVLGDLDALGVWAEDDATFTVALNSHCAYFIDSICTAAATMPVKETAAAAEDWGTSAAGLVTNGAYRMGGWSEEMIDLTLWDDYYNARRVNVHNICFSLGMSTGDALAAYEDGTVDVVMNSGDVEGSILSYNTDMTVLLVNQTAPELRREELRRALSAVIDRNALCAALGDSYIPAEGLIPRGISTSEGTFRELSGAVIDNTPENYETISAAAVESLMALGITPLALRQVTTVDLLYETPRHTALALELQKIWEAKLGLRVELHAAGAEDMLTELQTSSFSIALLDLDTDRDDATGYLGRFGSSSTVNYGLYYSAPYDMLLNVAGRSSSAQARDAYLEDAERLLLESGYVIPLLNTTHHWLIQPDLLGAFDTASGAHYFGNVRKAPTN